VGELDAAFLSREDELRRQIARNMLLLRRSEEHRRDLEKISSMLYRCDIAESPRFVRFLNRSGSQYPSGRGQEAVARRWLKAMPFNYRYFEISSESILPGNEEDYRWGYALSEEYVRELGFAVEPPMVEIPSRRSIHTVFKNSGGRGSFSPSLLQYALDYAAERGVSVFGPVYGVLLASIEEEEGLTGYFEAWLPIE